MCMFMMKEKQKKQKKTSKEKAERMAYFLKKFNESEAGKSMKRYTNYSKIF